VAVVQDGRVRPRRADAGVGCVVVRACVTSAAAEAQAEAPMTRQGSTRRTSVAAAALTVHLVHEERLHLILTLTGLALPHHLCHHARQAGQAQWLRVRAKIMGLIIMRTD
jgi:hypothetical protein